MNDSKTVLVADDDVLLLEILEFILETQGFKAKICRNGREVLSALSKEDVGLIMMDVLMPKMNGIETLRKIRSKSAYNAIPVVLMTGVYSQKQLKLKIDRSIRDYQLLMKPLSIDGVQNILFQYFGESRKINYEFPYRLKSKPSFRHRFQLASGVPGSNGSMHRLFYLPRKGLLASYRPAHLLHFTASYGGNWVLTVESPDFNGGLAVSEGVITAYWSDREDDLQETGFCQNAPFIWRFFRDFDKSNPHPWVSSRNGTPFKSFLYRFIVNDEGKFRLKPGKEIPVGSRRISGVPIDDVLLQICLGKYSDDLVHKVFSDDIQRIRVSEHFKSLKEVVLRKATDHLKVLRKVGSQQDLDAVLKASGFPKEKTYQILMGLYLIGGIELDKAVRAINSRDQLSRVDAVKFPDKREDLKRPVDFTASPAYKRFTAGCAGKYYDFLNVSSVCSSNKLRSAFNATEKYFSQISRNSRNIKEKLMHRAISGLLRETRYMLFSERMRHRYDSALRASESSDSGKVATFHFEKGNGHLAEGHVYRASGHYKICILIDPTNAGFFESALDALMLSQDDLAVAFEISRQGRDMFPENVKILEILGRCYFEMAETELAKDIYRKILNKDPSNYAAMDFLLQFPDERRDIFGL